MLSFGCFCAVAQDEHINASALTVITCMVIRFFIVALSPSGWFIVSTALRNRLRIQIVQNLHCGWLGAC